MHRVRALGLLHSYSLDLGEPFLEQQVSPCSALIHLLFSLLGLSLMSLVGGDCHALASLRDLHGSQFCVHT
jgi:hypothetical protein